MPPALWAWVRCGNVIPQLALWATGMAARSAGWLAVRMTLFLYLFLAVGVDSGDCSVDYLQIRISDHRLCEGGSPH